MSGGRVLGRQQAPPARLAHPPAGVQIQWLDGPAWRLLGPAAYATPGDGQLLRTVLVRAHGTLVLRIRLIAVGGAPPSTGELYLSVLPDRASFPGPIRHYPPTSSEFGSLVTTT